MAASVTKRAPYTRREENECRQLAEAAKWLKKMEQRFANQRKQVEARHRKLLQRANKVSKRHKTRMNRR